jgi:hypothetical protein
VLKQGCPLKGTKPFGPFVFPREILVEPNVFHSRVDEWTDRLAGYPMLGISPDRDIPSGWRDIGGPCGSLPTAPEKAARKPARKAGVLAHEDKVPREMDSLLEERRFELSVPP